MDRTIYKNPELASHRKKFIGCIKEGNSCRRLGKLDESLKHFAEARQHAYKLLSVRPLVLSRCYMFIADVYQLKGNHARATKCYDKSIRYAIMDWRLGNHHKHIAWLLAKRAQTRLGQIPEKQCFVSSSLIQLALEVMFKDAELVGIIAVGFFAYRLLKDVSTLAGMRRKG